MSCQRKPLITNFLNYFIPPPPERNYSFIFPLLVPEILQPDSGPSFWPVYFHFKMCCSAPIYFIAHTILSLQAENTPYYIILCYLQFNLLWHPYRIAGFTQLRTTTAFSSFRMPPFTRYLYFLQHNLTTLTK